MDYEVQNNEGYYTIDNHEQKPFYLRVKHKGSDVPGTF
jgi:hypothetical protein